jgi:hypothetical protein
MTHNYLKIYDFYRVSGLNPEMDKEGNHYGDCPFCGADTHFSVRAETGQFRCLKCDASGNVHTFFKLLHEKHFKTTTKEQYKLLAEARGLPASLLKTAKFAFDAEYDRWLVPFEDSSKYPHNLGVFWPSTKDPYRVLKSPELPLKFYRPFDRKSLTDDIWVFEGEWDLLAAKAAFNVAAVDAPSMVSTSGASTWTPQMNKLVKGKSCVFMWDNDKGGLELGPKAIKKRISDCKHFFVKWPEHLAPHVKDVRDVWTKCASLKIKQKDVVLELMNMAADVATSSPESDSETSSGEGGFYTNFDEIEEIETYEEYQSRIKSLIYTNESMLQSYDMALASCISIKLKNDKPIWLLIVGQAATGKSTLIESFGGTSEHFEYTSRFTSEAFLSGKTGEDNSLIHDVINGPDGLGKTLFVGDLTVILNLPIPVQEKLWGLLREAYGGTLKISFGNQKAKEFHRYKFNMVAGVTHAIYAHNDSEMGERFLKFDFAGPDFDQDAHMIRAMSNQDSSNNISDELKRTVLGYYKHLYSITDVNKPPVVPESTKAQIRKLAIITAHLRTKVQKDRFEGIIARPVVESPTRIALQLQTVCKALMWVHQKDHVTPEIYKILKKAAFDSCPGLPLEVIHHIHKSGDASQSQLCSELKLPKTRIHQILTDFKTMGILEYKDFNNGSGRRGRNTHFYSLSTSVLECLDGLKETKFKSKPSKKFSGKPKKAKH